MRLAIAVGASNELIMARSFLFDVFLSYSSIDKARVERMARRLREAGLRVWFDKWVIKPGMKKPSKELSDIA